MRRALGLAFVATIMPIAVGACANDSAQGLAGRGGGVDRSVAMVLPSPHVVLANMRRQVCASAIRAAHESFTLFNTQMAVIDKAAANNDEATVITAATLITDQLVELATTLEALARQSAAASGAAPVTVALARGSVAAALARGSITVAHMASASYDGTSADQRQELVALNTAIAAVCR